MERNGVRRWFRPCETNSSWRGGDLRVVRAETGFASRWRNLTGADWPITKRSVFMAELPYSQSIALILRFKAKLDLFSRGAKKRRFLRNESTVAGRTSPVAQSAVVSGEARDGSWVHVQEGRRPKRTGQGAVGPYETNLAGRSRRRGLRGELRNELLSWVNPVLSINCGCFAIQSQICRIGIGGEERRFLRNELLRTTVPVPQPVSML